MWKNSTYFFIPSIVNFKKFEKLGKIVLQNEFSFGIYLNTCVIR
jgi:hypothetical protein